MMDKDRLPDSLDLKKISAAIVSTLTIIVLISAAAVHYVDSQEVERQSSSQNISFKVVEPSTTENETNLKVNTGDHLRFGEMPNGTSQTRYLRWNTSSITLARVKIEGNASEYVSHENVVVFDDSYKLALEANTKELGYYEGEVQIDFEAPRTRRALKWLKLKTQHLY